YTVTFSESVTGVGTGDFSLTAGGVSGASVNSVTGSGSVYTVTVGTGSGSGTLRLDVRTTATVNDAAGNAQPGTGFTTGPAYTIDKTPPAVQSVALAGAALTNAASVQFTVTFSEAVTGVDAGDFAATAAGVSGAGVTGVSGSG